MIIFYRMANTEIQQPIRSVYKDGSIVVSNVKSKIDNSTTSYSVVVTWYDGTPMDDSKVDEWGIYSKYKETGEYLRENKPQWGELFLEVNTVADLRAMSMYNQFLIKIGYYKGVRLAGYYKKSDTPASIEYFLYSGSETDDGGSFFVLDYIKIKHDFNKVINLLYYGVKIEDASLSSAEQAAVRSNNSDRIETLISRNLTGVAVTLPPGILAFSREIILPPNYSIAIVGYNTGGHNNRSSVFKFYGTSGILNRGSYCEISDLSILEEGRLPSSSINAVTKSLGHIGLKFENYLTSSSNSGFYSTNLRIQGFNTQIAIVKNSSEGVTWSGAYRYFYNTHLSLGDIGIYAEDSTLNNFSGGQLTYCGVNGIYATAQTAEVIQSGWYTRLMFSDGFIFEKNGPYGPDNYSFLSNDNSRRNYGLYIENASWVDFTGSYIEDIRCVVADNAILKINGGHLHKKSTAFFSYGRGGIDISSIYPFYNKLTPTFSVGGADYSTMFYSISSVISPIPATNSFSFSSTNNTSGQISFLPRNTHILLKNVEAINLMFIKVSFRVKITSTSNKVVLKTRIVDNYIDSTTRQLADDFMYDARLIENIGDGKFHTIEFIRWAEWEEWGSYKKIFDLMQFAFTIENQDSGTSGISGEISDLQIEFYSKEPITPVINNRTIDATTYYKGLVNQAIAQNNISQGDLVNTSASDVAGLVSYINSNIVPLVNAIKKSQNDELNNQRTAGQQSTI